MDGNVTMKTVETVEATGQALKAAGDIVEAFDREKTAAAALAPSTVELLKEARLIEEGDSSRALQKLATHDGAIELCRNLISHQAKVAREYEQKLAAAGQGQPITAKEAGVAGGANGEAGHLTSNSAPILGRRTGLGEKRASDQVFLQRLGLADRLS